jgi:hypothetical protein
MSASAAAAVEDDAPPSPPRQRGSLGLTWRQPTTEEAAGDWPTPEQLSAATAGEATLPDLGDGSPSEDAPSHAPSDHDESDRPSSPASSGRRASLGQKAQTAAARQAVKIAGSMAHQYLARDDAAKAAGLYLVDDESAAEIGDPLARLAARHAPMGGEINEDVADGIAAMMGVAHFVSKQIERSAEAAAHRAGMAPAPVDAATL